MPSKLRMLRFRKGLTQYHLSNLTGIPQSVISLMENGWARVKPLQAEKLAEVLECEIEGVLGFQKSSEMKVD